MPEDMREEPTPLSQMKQSLRERCSWIDDIVPAEDKYECDLPSAFLPGNDNTPVWRYMNYWKFKDLIEKKSLYFCRADLHPDDPSEGTYALGQIQARNAYLQSINPELAADDERRRRETRKRTYVNCWCVGECDCDLMWRAYTSNGRGKPNRPNRPGVAIRSSVGRLLKIREAAVEQPLFMGLVKYVDFASGEWVDELDSAPILNKDKHFALDMEMRLFFENHANSEGEWLPIRLSVLIERVVLKPSSTKNDMAEVKDLLVTAKLSNVGVDISRYDRPFSE